MSCFDVKILDPNINTIEIETCIGDQPASIDVITYDNTSTVEINHCVALLPSEINDLITVKDIIAGSGISVSDSSGIYTVSLSNPTISSSGIVDFLESVQDVIGNSGLVAGNYININYDDSSGYTTISATGLQPSGNYSVIGHTHLSTDITDSTSFGRNILTASSYAAQNKLGWEEIISSSLQAKVGGQYFVKPTPVFVLVYFTVTDPISPSVGDFYTIIKYPGSQTIVVGGIIYNNPILIYRMYQQTNTDMLNPTFGWVTYTLNSFHTHTSSDIINFNSAVSGLLPVKNISAGSGIGISSVSGDFTVSVTGTFGLTSEEVDDRISNLLLAGNYVNLNYNDLGNSLTISVTGVQPSGNYSVVGHSHVSSEITDFNTAVSGLLPPAHDAAVPWTENHTLVDGTRYLVNDLVYESGYLYRANYDNESIPVSDPLYWTNVGPGYRLNIDGRDIPNIPYPVTSVNSQTGDVNITSIDISDFNSAVSGLIPPSNFTSLSGINGIDVSNSGTDYTVALAGSGNFDNLTVNNIDVSVSGHNHVYTDITNFASGVDAALSTALIAGTGIYLYEDTLADTLSINVTGVSMVGHNHTSSDITDFNSSVSGLLPYQVYTSGNASNSIIPISGTNFNSGINSTIGGGTLHTISNDNSFIGGGTNNNITSINSVVVGGSGNWGGGNYSFVGGGYDVEALGDYSAVVGGQYNNNSGDYSLIGGGINNTISGNYSAILGGQLNNDNGYDNVFILGSNLLASQPNTTYTENLISQSGNFTSLSVNTTGVSLIGHTHTSSDITDFNSGVSGLLPSVTGIGYVTSSFAGNTYTIGVTGLQPSGNYSLVGHTHTSSDITDFNSSVSGLIPVKNILSGTGISISNASGIYTIEATGSGVLSDQAKSLITTVFNKTGSPIPKMTAVYIDGGQGDLPTVSLAIATTDMTSAGTYGLTYETISNMQSGKVIVFGALTGLDTDQFNPTAPHGNVNGSVVYLSPSVSGALTLTKPSAPNHIVAIGTIVRTHQNEGVIEVRVQNGFELDELHNVAISGVTNGQFLQYNSSTQLWAPSSSGNFTTLQLNGTGVVASSGGTNDYLSKFTSSNTIADSLIYDDGTNIGIGTSSPENLVHISGDASANSIFRAGSLEFQPYALNNAWVGENVYFNGSDFIRRQTGAAGLFYFQGNEGQFRFSNSDSAGTPISYNPVWKILSDGSMGVGTGLDYTTGSLAGASFKIASNGGVAVKDDIYGYVSAGIHRMQVVCDDSSTTGPLVLIGGNAGVEMWKDSTPSKAASFGMAVPGNTATDDLNICLYDGISWNPRLFIQNSDGKVGINNTSPSYTLHITGSGNFSDSLFVNDVAVSVSGHTHASSDITDFNTAVSGLVSGIYQPILTNPVTGTGIVNHIAYWDSSSGIAADSGQLVWDSTNNRLGIGSASPDASLVVSGDTYTTGKFGVGGACRSTLSSDLGATVGLAWSESTFIGMQFQNTDQYRMGMMGIAGTRQTRILAKSADNSGIITFFPGAGTSEAARFNHLGRLGIGTTSPSGALHVVGTSGIRVGDSSANSYIYGPSGNAHIHLNQGTNNILLNSNTYANSSVSINTQTTNLNNASVNVNGTLQFPKTGTATSTATQKDPNLVRFFHSFWNGTSSYDGYNDIRSIVSTTVNQQSRLGFLINNGDGTQNLTERLSISSSGNIGINKTAPTVALDVVGNANISGTLTLLSDVFTLSNNKTIAASGDAGTKGNICWDNNYLYICVDNNNWKRISYDSW